MIWKDIFDRMRCLTEVLHGGKRVLVQLLRVESQTPEVTTVRFSAGILLVASRSQNQHDIDMTGWGQLVLRWFTLRWHIYCCNQQEVQIHRRMLPASPPKLNSITMNWLMLKIHLSRSRQEDWVCWAELTISWSFWLIFYMFRKPNTN